MEPTLSVAERSAGVDPAASALPTISVVVPLYQKRHRVLACLASVQSQSLAPLEVLVVDDGSTDGGADLVRELGDDLIRVVHQDNQGVSAARNLGLGLARGDYVAFLDADDTWQPEHLRTLAELAVRHPAATILGTGWSEGGQPVNDAGFGTGERVVDLDTFLARTAAGHPPLWTSAVAVRRDRLESSSLFPVGSRLAEDQYAWLTMLKLGAGVRSPAVTADYFVDPLNPTVARPHADDFDSVIFNEWSRERSAGYRRFTTAHRLYTIERHIGHTPDRLLLGHLLRTGRPLQPARRLRIIARMVRRHLLRLARRLRPTPQRTAVIPDGGK
ncbi:MAG: glycosyltransferase family 2 protein [Propionibacteriaceae bacterium]|nr:glycosyltransferase family 2 protein [Propionibacteriaceae bacterium]